MGEFKFVEVYQAEGNLAGEMIRIMLESFGIPVIIQQESAGQTYGLTVGPMGLVSIMVPVDDAQEARRILASMESGELSNDQENSGNENA